MSLAITEPIVPQAPVPVVPREVARLRSELLYLGDVADLSQLDADMRERAASLVLMRLARRRAPSQLSAAALFARARVLMPGLSPWLPRQTSATVRLQWDASAQAADMVRDCLKVEAAMTAGSVASSGQFKPHRCADLPSIAFRYDHARQAVITTRDLMTGELVSGFAGARNFEVGPGETMIMRVAVGSVTVERPVEALQRGRPGHKLFVKTDDGEVLAIDVPRQLP